MIRFPVNTTIIGEIRCKGAVRVDSRIEGEGNIQGVLLISKSCVWVGKITADKVIIEGTVEGEIIARQKIQLSSSAKVTGNIIAPEMLIAKGAIINSKVDIAKIRIPVELINSIKARKEEPGLANEFVDELAQRRKTIQKSA